MMSDMEIFVMLISALALVLSVKCLYTFNDVAEEFRRLEAKIDRIKEED